MELKSFKEELRAKIHDFSTACALTNLSDTKPESKKAREIEERYQRLEAWIIDNRPNTLSTDVVENLITPIVPDENQIPLDF